jgi:hypothetical protein
LSPRLLDRPIKSGDDGSGAALACEPGRKIQNPAGLSIEPAHHDRGRPALMGPRDRRQTTSDNCDRRALFAGLILC